MGRRECPVLIEMNRQRFPAGIDARSRVVEPAEVSLALRDKGWSPYRVWFDVRVAAVIYRSDATADVPATAAETRGAGLAPTHVAPALAPSLAKGPISARMR
jgi:hypothetical protein